MEVFQMLLSLWIVTQAKNVALVLLNSMIMTQLTKYVCKVHIPLMVRE